MKIKQTTGGSRENVDIQLMTKNTKIYIAGHRGMVGSAVWRALESKGYNNLIGKTNAELDLRNQQAVLDFMRLKNLKLLLTQLQGLAGFWQTTTIPINF